jgi:hypothetical protein
VAEELGMSRFCSSFFPPEIRPRQREVLIESYRKGKIAETFRAFKEIYLEFVDEVIVIFEARGWGFLFSKPLTLLDKTPQDSYFHACQRALFLGYVSSKQHPLICLFLPETVYTAWPTPPRFIAEGFLQSARCSLSKHVEASAEHTQSPTSQAILARLRQPAV